MAQVLIDTSVWVEFFNRPHSIEKAVVDELIDRDQIVIAGPIISELFQGVSNAHLLQLLTDRFEAMPYVEMTKSLWRMAGDLGSALRRQGISIPLTDLVIATLAIEHGLRLYSLDKHFNQIPHLLRFHPA